ncbi:6961_t:CDS:2 [Ambispora leptoticha]|uniref:6961_t:CDS:1 n=1 Tax=Ambispora leptoticha TaxID=144679 RepID=A0A9N8YLQ9_9GLOM|nr:6961_t:CDS:2 [Ambispora leptoticha]
MNNKKSIKNQETGIGFEKILELKEKERQAVEKLKEGYSSYVPGSIPKEVNIKLDAWNMLKVKQLLASITNNQKEVALIRQILNNNQDVDGKIEKYANVKVPHPECDERGIAKYYFTDIIIIPDDEEKIQEIIEYNEAPPIKEKVEIIYKTCPEMLCGDNPCKAPFLTIAEDLLKLIKEDKVEKLIFLSAYDKRKFPNGDERKAQIFKQTFVEVKNMYKISCYLRPIPFENDNPYICRDVLRSLGGVSIPFSEIKVLTPHYPTIESQHDERILLVKQEVIPPCSCGSGVSIDICCGIHCEEHSIEEVEKLINKAEQGQCELKLSDEIMAEYLKAKLRMNEKNNKIKERMIELCAKKFLDIEAKATDIRELALAIIELANILKEMEKLDSGELTFHFEDEDNKLYLESKDSGRIYLFTLNIEDNDISVF